MDRYFSCASPLDRRNLFLFGEKFIFGKKLESPLILFYFKIENKTRKKTLKNDSKVLEKHVFEKPESRSGNQVTYREGTSKR